MQKFRIIAVICLIAMLVTLCGCDTEPDDPVVTDPSIGTDLSIVTSPADENGLVITTQYLPGNVENPDDLPVLKWVCLTESIYGGGNRIWSEEAAVEVNELLEERNMPFRVQFVILTINQFLLNSDWLNRPEAQEALEGADLIFASMSATEIQTYLAPITPYATGEASPSLKNAVLHQSRWYKVRGEVYAIPVIPGVYRAAGWRIDSDALESYGLSVGDFNASFGEMDAVFEKIYQKNGNKQFLYISQDGTVTAQGVVGDVPMSYYPGAIDSMLSICVHTIGYCYAIDYSTDQPTVTNYLELSNVKNWQAAIRRYIEAGYVTRADDKGTISYEGYPASSFCTLGDGTVWVPVENPLITGSPYGTYVSGIAADTSHMEEALKLLALIADDEDFRLHFFYGEEGRDYIIDEGYYQIVKEGNQSYSLDFLSPLSYFCGLTAHPEASDNPSVGTRSQGTLATADGMTLLQTIQDNLNNSFMCCPVAFDFTGLDTELTAVCAVLEDYFGRFSRLTEDEYSQMLQDLKDAGSDVIQAELQRQLDVWLAENPDWND